MVGVRGSVQALHQSESGVREGPLNHNPHAFAYEVSRYISCPSTVRVRTLERFGRSPSLASITAMRAKHLAGRDAFKLAIKYDEPADEAEAAPALEFIPKPVRNIHAFRKPKAHPRALWPSWYQPPALRCRLLGTELVRSVAFDFGLTVEEMRGRGKTALLVEARAVVMRILRLRGVSYPLIARALGRDDHSTAIHSVENFDVYAARNPMVLNSFERHRTMDALA